MNHSAPEPLETRIAPATLLNPTTVIFQDLDGDTVTVKFSKPLFADPDGLATANLVLNFDTGDIDADATNDTPQQLQVISLSGHVGVADGVGITITAKRDAVRGGDGFADVGHINAAGLDLGIVSVAGDLGAIAAGNPNVAGSALKALTVQSFGELGLSTGAPDLFSIFDGRVDKLTVKGHVRDARLLVLDSVLTNPVTDGEAAIGSLVIGGSLIGGAAGFSGSISATDRIDSVKIGGDIRGGTLSGSGVVGSRSMGAVNIGGSIIGDGPNTGRLVTGDASIDSIFIGGDIRGGSGSSSGQVAVGAETTTRSFQLGGSLIGGDGIRSGRIVLESPVGSFSIGGDIRGGSMETTGQVQFGAGVGSIDIGGSLRAGAGSGSAVIQAVAGDPGTVKIGGSMDGTLGDGGAQLDLRSAKSITVGGSLIGGGVRSGLIDLNDDLGTAKIGGSLLGGDGEDSGRIEVGGKLGSIAIGGSLIGGDGDGSGRLRVSGSLGKATIAGDLRGGDGPSSGGLLSSDRATSISIGGSVYAGVGLRSGAVLSGDDIVSLTIRGSLIGLPGQPAAIVGEDDPNATATSHLVLGKITIGGRVENALILAGYDFLDPTNGDAQIGSITVGGDWIASSIVAGVEAGADGFFGTADDQAMTNGNTAAIVSRIGSVTIKGQTLGTVGGVDGFGIVAEEVGAVKVGAFSETLIAGEVDAVPLGATLDFIAREDVVGADLVLPTFVGVEDLTIVSPTTATWTDVDGDLVTLKVSKPILDLGDFTRIVTGAGVQVQRIDLADDALDAQGTAFTLTAKPQDVNGDDIPDGDGFVNLGFLAANGVDLGAVNISGDLGRIAAGDSGSDAAFKSPGVKSLTTQSLGLFGTSTQAAGGDLSSTILGPLGVLTTRGDVKHVVFGVIGSGGGFGLDESGIGKVTIGGSLRGGDVQAESGQITSTGNIGPVTIGGGLFGGAEAGSATVRSQGAVGGVKIGGALVGGAGNVSAQINAVDGIASATIGGDIRGGGGEASGALDGGDFIGAVKIGGSMIGGVGEESGSLLAEQFGGEIKSVKIGGDVRGGIGVESAYIHAGQKLGAVTIAGSLVGGSGPNAGDGAFSALIYAGNAISTGNVMAGVTIGGDVVGGSGLASASIGSAFGVAGNIAYLDIGKIAIKGSILGDGVQSAAITANNIKSLTLGGSLIGVGSQSGSIVTSGLLSALKIGGSVIGEGNSSGGLSAQALGKLTIGRDVRGGDGNFSGQIFVNLDGAKSIAIGGSMESGTGTRAGSVNVNSPLGSLTIKGSVWGTAADPALILARGTDMQTSPLALGKLTIGGSAEFLDVLGGYLDQTQSFNADANLGKISIGGTWRAGDIVAGVNAGVDGEFATIDDQRGAFGNDFDTFSKIASITIKGRVLGTVGGTDDFGFSAETIGAVKVGAVSFALKNGPGNDNHNLPAEESARLRVSSTGDVRIHEVPISM